MAWLGALIKYGAIGLALALAVLSYKLLKAEQARPSVRRSMLRGSYIFMGFSILLAVIGFGAEVYTSAKLHQYESVLSSIDDLMDVKAQDDALQGGASPARNAMKAVIAKLDAAAEAKLFTRARR